MLRPAGNTAMNESPFQIMVRRYDRFTYYCNRNVLRCRIFHCGSSTRHPRRILTISETQFVDQQGKPLIGAQLYGIDQWGTSRMGWMFRRVLTECLANENHANALNNMALILIVPEPERPGATENWSDEIYQGCTAQYDFHPCSCVVPSGKVGLASALAMASDFLTTGQVRRVLQLAWTVFLVLR
jgi:hypothetical protein